jgi:O-antigen/teichoic acid export membrane protein
VSDAGSAEDEGMDEMGTASAVDKLDPAIISLRPNMRRMLMSTSATVILQGVSLLLGFATSVLLAHFLGGVGYGRYVYTLAWAGLLTTPAVLGLDRFLVRGMAQYEVKEEWQLMKGLLKRTNELVLIASIVIAASGCAIATVFLGGTLRWAFCVSMLLIPLTALTTLRQAAMQAIGRVVSGQLPEYLIRPVLVIVGIGTLEVIGHGALTATTAIAVNISGVAVAFIVGAMMLRRALPTLLRSVTAQYETRAWVRASLPMMLISGVWLANNYLATLVVGTLDGPRAAGVYSVAEKGAELIVVVLVAANIPLAPAIARLHARGDRDGLQHATERIAQVTLLASAPLALGFAIFPDLYLGIFGASFRTGATALTILALSQMVNAAAGPAGNVLLMTGHERAAVGGIGAGMVANLVLAIVLVPSLGVTGGAIASGSSLVLWNTVLLMLARQRVGVNVTAFRSLRVIRSPSSDL